MEFADKTLTCRQCGASFVFTAGEQEFYQTRGLQNEPSRCPSCRVARRQERQGGGSGLPRQMYPAICSSCGAETEVPFNPRGDRPVYCAACFSKMKGPRTGQRQERGQGY